MKQGTIQIDCGKKDCGYCQYRCFEEENNKWYCNLFFDPISKGEIMKFKRCQQCLETFEEIKDEK